MSEEEKKAIETVESFIKYYKTNEQTGNRANLDVLREECQAIEFILNKYDVTQKELNSLKEIEKSHQEENGKLRVELEQEKARNEKLQYKIDEKELIIDGMKEDRRIAIEEIREEYYISKDKIRKIVDEHIPKQPNIITGEMEYTPNTNANSFLVQDILELLEEK